MLLYQKTNKSPIEYGYNNHPWRSNNEIPYVSGARGVVNKGRLTLDDAQLKVTIKPPEKKPPTDTRRLLVKGLSDRTTLDGLQCYMEVVSRLEVLSIEFGEQGCALVTFNETYGKFV